MNLYPYVGKAEVEIECFIWNLKQTFHGETWEEVGPCARRAWRAVGFDEIKPWKDVEDRVRASWASDQPP